jgi:hypothetical protein
MAETHFFMTRDDSLGLISFLIDVASAEFVPEKSPDPPPFPRYSTVAEIEARMDRDLYDSRFFVVSREWERFPLVINEIQAKDGRNFFSVAQRYGGPAFDLVISRTRSKENVQWMLSGWFSDYAYYIQDAAFHKDHSLYRTFDRPERMTSVHKEVQKYIRRNSSRSVCQENGHIGPWIALGALKEYESGIWLRAGDYHFVPKPKVSKTRRAKRCT